MTWTSEGHKMNSNSRIARDIEKVGNKDLIKIAGAILGFDINTAKFAINKLLKEGWLKELPDRYVMTEKARQRIEMLHERVKRGIMT